jgi:hypothetical protein
VNSAVIFGLSLGEDDISMIPVGVVDTVFTKDTFFAHYSYMNSGASVTFDKI